MHGFAARFNSILIMKILARIISNIFSPLLMPTYGIFMALWLSILTFLPASSKWGTLAVVLGLTAILPMLFIAVIYKFKIVSNLNISIRSERWLPYLFIMLCYAATAIYLIMHHAPVWLSTFIWGALIAVAISFLINFAWKISGHAAGIGGVVAMLCVMQYCHLAILNITPIVCIAIIFAGMIGSARVYLGRHTVGQVLTGFANGFICVLLASFIFN